MELRQPAHSLIPLGRGDVCILQQNNKVNIYIRLNRTGLGNVESDLKIKFIFPFIWLQSGLNILIT